MYSSLFFICHVMHAGNQIQAGQSQVEGTNAQMFWEYLPFKLSLDAAVYHLNGRFHAEVYTIFGKDAQFYGPQVIVDHLG